MNPQLDRKEFLIDVLLQYPKCLNTKRRRLCHGDIDPGPEGQVSQHDLGTGELRLTHLGRG
jgi:hypothetical protein